MKKYIILIILLLTFIIPINTKANDKVNVYLFYSDSCIHCHHANEAINEILKTRDDINYYKYETTLDKNAYNRTLLEKVSELFGIDRIGYPLVVIGNEYHIGFGDSTKEKYISLINFYKNKDYLDQTGVIVGVIEDNGKDPIKAPKDYTIDTLFGKINLKELSLPLVAIVVGFTDGFNPCAMWVLLFLISMLLTIKEKKKSWLLGIIFILTSGFVYFIFMMAWLKITTYMNQVSLLRNIIALFAIIFGLYNLYTYYKTRKEDGCTVIKKEKRKFFITKIKNIVNNKSLILAIIGIIILATVVNLIELLCSMGLPVMFTEVLSLNNLSDTKYLFYILLYLFFFMIDDVIIFTISMISLKQTAISTKYNKYSHLIGGIIMFLIGLLLIFKPGWLSFNF